MSFTIRINASTAQQIKDRSLTHDADGKPTETYDSIIRRALAALEKQQTPVKTVDMRRL